jgi:hypothetical protein
MEETLVNIDISQNEIENFEKYHSQNKNDIINNTGSDVEECPICYNIIDGALVKTPCNHIFCYNCYMYYYDKTNIKDCPLCRQDVGSKIIKPSHNVIVEMDFQKSYSNNGMGYFGMSRSYFLWINVFILNRYAHETPDIIYDIDTDTNLPTLLLTYNRYKKVAFTLPAYICDIEFNPLKLVDNDAQTENINNYKTYSFFISGCRLVDPPLLESIIRLQTFNIHSSSTVRPDYRGPNQPYDRLIIRLSR